MVIGTWSHKHETTKGAQNDSTEISDEINRKKPLLPLAKEHG